MASDQVKPPDPVMVDILDEFEVRNGEIKNVCKKMDSWGEAQGTYCLENSVLKLNYVRDR